MWVLSFCSYSEMDNDCSLTLQFEPFSFNVCTRKISFGAGCSTGAIKTKTFYGLISSDFQYEEIITIHNRL